MKTDILILGAGMAGLTAARFLQEHGHSVQLVDKGRGVGGRVATRRMGPREQPTGRWDHGAQFVTLRSSALKKTLKAWGVLETVPEWIPSHSDPSLMRRCPPDGMNAFAKSLAKGLTIHNSERICELRREKGFTLVSESGETFSADTCILTPPAPQLLDLFNASSVEVPETALNEVSGIQYDRTLSLLAELDGPSGIPKPGYAKPSSGILDTLIDQFQKGISAAHTVTAHATSAFSLEWYDRDRNAAASVLRAALSDKLESKITSVQIHGWKFSYATRRIEKPFLQLTEGLFAAGDGFEAGDETVSPSLHPRIESAMLSGLSVATECC